MALGPRLDLRQSQSLVMTPQLQQAIKLLALSNLEIETFIGEALESNPLLDLGDTAPAPVEPAEPEFAGERRTTLESSPVDQLVSEGRAEDDRPLDIDVSALDRDRDTGDWGGDLRLVAGEDGPGIDERAGEAPTLAEHLFAQIGAATRDAGLAFIARHIAGLLDEAGYLTTPLRTVAEELGAPLAEVEAALALVHTLDPTGVGARGLSECLALQAKEADRYDPCMARLIDNLELLARGELARLFLDLYGLGKPTIAKVRGFCLAGGFGLALACDLVIASDDATFATPEINVGLWPYMITVPLTRSMPPKKALELMMTGRRIDAAEADALGLLTRVVSAADLDGAVAETAALLASKSPSVMKMGRDSFYSVWGRNAADSLAQLHPLLTLNTSLEDAAEGITAFLEKRDPVWTGR